MNGLRRYAFVLAVYLNTRGSAFVLFEGPLAPVDWSVREIRGSRKHARCLARIVTILDQYLPDVLVLQDTSAQGTRRAGRIVKLNEAVAALAKVRGLPVYAYSRDEVWEAFASFGVANKQALAEIIAKHIPAFERYVPPPRKPWKSEDARMGIFDAAALALTFFNNGSNGNRQVR
jgi:Holliday junction resolvasome RuvABC endonuclease subunit